MMMAVLLEITVYINRGHGKILCQVLIYAFGLIINLYEKDCLFNRLFLNTI